MSMIAGARWPLRERWPVPADLLLLRAWLVWVMSVAFVVALDTRRLASVPGAVMRTASWQLPGPAAYHRATI